MDNNAPITEHGLFWLRDNDQKRLWGTLYVNEINEANLETFGSLIDPYERGYHTIVGQITSGQELVTLIDCFPTNTRNPWSSQDGQTDWSHQTCLVNRVVKGIGFEKGEEVAFEQATLSISTLPQWADPNQVKIDLAEGRTRPIHVNISIEDRADETTEAVLGGEKLRISLVFRPNQKWDINRKITRYVVEDHCLLTIERSDGSRMSLESILSVTRAMLDLLCICCNETPTVANFSVQYGKDDPRPVELRVRMRGYDTASDEGRSYLALGLEDIGGMVGVAQWIRVRERYGAAVALLTSNWYNDKAYNEDKISRMYTAVEGLLSRKKKRKKAKMAPEELAEFVEKAIPNFSGITNRLSQEWAERVKDIRDQKISHSDPTSTVAIDGRSMHVMANVLYVAGASFLLREMGLGENLIGKFIRGCYQSLQLNEQQ